MDPPGWGRRKPEAVPKGRPKHAGPWVFPLSMNDRIAIESEGAHEPFMFAIRVNDPTSHTLQNVVARRLAVVRTRHVHLGSADAAADAVNTVAGDPREITGINGLMARR